MRLVLVHQLGAARVDHTGQVGDPDVLAAHAQLDQQAQAGQCCSAGAGGDQLDVLRALASDFEATQNGRAHHNGRAMLVVVEHRNVHALAQLALHIETVGRLDVFQVDAAKRRLQRSDDLDQFFRVFFVDLDVEHVDARELLEQDRLAFHHRLAGQRADVAQAQHGRAVGDHADQVATAGVAKGRVRVLDDFFAGRGHAGRISQRQIKLVDHLLGGSDGNLAGLGKLVVFESSLAQQGALVDRGDFGGFRHGNSGGGEQQRAGFRHRLDAAARMSATQL